MHEQTPKFTQIPEAGTKTARFLVPPVLEIFRVARLTTANAGSVII
jgi:hypothetical protein